METVKTKPRKEVEIAESMNQERSLEYGGIRGLVDSMREVYTPCSNLSWRWKA